MLSVTLASPECEIFQGNAHWIVLPGDEGDFGVYPSHISLISGLRFGVVEVLPEGHDTPMKWCCYAGVALVEATFVRVLSPRFFEGTMTKKYLEGIREYMHEHQKSSCQSLQERTKMMESWLKSIELTQGL